MGIYNHYKRISQKREDRPCQLIKKTLKQHAVGELEAIDSISENDAFSSKVRIEKSNILLTGPSGSGKTFLVKTIAQVLDVPFAVCDCANVTETGYIGGDVDWVLEDLLQAAGGDLEKAQQGLYSSGIRWWVSH